MSEYLDILLGISYCLGLLAAFPLFEYIMTEWF